MKRRRLQAARWGLLKHRDRRAITLSFRSKTRMTGLPFLSQYWQRYFVTRHVQDLSCCNQERQTQRWNQRFKRKGPCPPQMRGRTLGVHGGVSSQPLTSHCAGRCISLKNPSSFYNRLKGPRATVTCLGPKKRLRAAVYCTPNQVLGIASGLAELCA